MFAILVLWRARGSRSLSEHSSLPETSAPPRLSIIVPARNEELNIEKCLDSIRASEHPNLEIIVVDDHSQDSTGKLAAAIAGKDARVVVTSPPALPTGWFGKSWACAHGASLATGDLFLFTDADTWHHPELHIRLCNARVQLGADLLSVAGSQEVVTFWEKLLQPMVFLLLLLRYGGTGIVNRSTRTRDKIANGQCILTTREAYEAVGGHASVRDSVAEDLRLAQVFFAAGKKPMLELALPYLSTRMYRSLGEVVGGWGKNIFAGSAHTMPHGWFMRRVLAPLMLLTPPLAAVLAPVLLLLGCVGAGSPTILVVLATANIAMLLLFAAVFITFRVNPLYALLYPLGAAVLLYIVGAAIARGQHVTWKGRSYTSA
jgi:chlorobactene glucosyltransferase